MKLSIVLLTVFTVWVRNFSVQGSPTNTEGKRVVCYFSSWSVYRQGQAAITADQILPELCTHFIFTFVGLDEAQNKVKLLDPDLILGAPWRKALLPELHQKAKAQGTKFLVAMGGWGEGSAPYSNVVSNPARRAVLVSSICDFVEKYELDGFDLDWEYPAERGGAYSDRAAYSAFVDELYSVFQVKGWVLSAAVNANPLTINHSYDVAFISTKLDMINLMAYDLHGSWETKTGHHAALYSGSSDASNEKHLNIEAVVKKWIELGADPRVLNLGLATYGRGFVLTDPSSHKIGSPAGGLPNAGWIGENGFIGYNEICYKNGSYYTTGWDDEQQVPYAYSGNQWVGFDDVRSVRQKTCLAKDFGLGGMMFWTLDTDDFRGDCGLGKFPLINTVAAALADSTCGSSNSLPTTISPTSTTLPQTTQEPYTTVSPTTEAPTTTQPPSTTAIPTITPTTSLPATTPSPTTTQPSTTATPTTEVPSTASSTTDQPPATTTSTTTEVPTTNPPKTTETAPTPIEPVAEVPEDFVNSSKATCDFVGQRFRDTSDCSSYFYCAPGVGNSINPLKMSCAGGTIFDSTISTCNFRGLVLC